MFVVLRAAEGKKLNLSITTLFFIVFVLCGSFYSRGAYAGVKDPSLLMFTIRLPMTPGELAQVVFPDGGTLDVGRVRAVPTKSRHPAFTASKYGLGGQVIATAANALHLQISVEDGSGRTISVIPAETFVAAPGFGTSFVIEGIGGTALWGQYAPYVGSPVYIVNPVGAPVLFNNIGLLQYASAVEIHVYRPEEEIEYLEIENWPGGKAWYHDAEGRDHPFALVEHGVSGTGRFGGTLYQGPGMVRANHPGVICVSTTRKMDIGGFQIVPLSHTYAREMQKSRRMGQYIILRGIDFEDLTGKVPFFRGEVRPGDSEMPERREGRVLGKTNGEWGPLPEVSGLTENTLTGIDALRIYLR